MTIDICLILCNPLDYSLPGISVHGIFQARILEQLPFPTPGDLFDPGIEPASLESPALADGYIYILPLSHPGSPIKQNIFFLKHFTFLFSVSDPLGKCAMAKSKSGSQFWGPETRNHFRTVD